MAFYLPADFTYPFPVYPPLCSRLAWTLHKATDLTAIMAKKGCKLSWPRLASCGQRYRRAWQLLWHTHTHAQPCCARVCMCHRSCQVYTDWHSARKRSHEAGYTNCSHARLSRQTDKTSLFFLLPRTPTHSHTHASELGKSSHADIKEHAATLPVKLLYFTHQQYNMSECAVWPFANMVVFWQGSFTPYSLSHSCDNNSHTVRFWGYKVVYMIQWSHLVLFIESFST